MKGAPVSIQRVVKTYGDVLAVNNISLDIVAGELLSLLGPSGSGKTTLLMMLAGFELPNTGSMLLGGNDITFMPPNKRNIGMVFQKYALFPHMTVAQNVGYPLRMRKVPRDVIRQRVANALDLVRLGSYGDRMPSQLSGGQQQRVAVARAMIFEPPVLLMDEPLGALDKKLREQLQIEIKSLQERLAVTVVYVTHDQEEALKMSDRIAVLNEGVLEQVGTPADLYRKPQSAFVADFIGKMNFISGEIHECQSGVSVVRLSEQHFLRLSADVSANPALQRGQKVQIAVRPESLGIASAGQGGQSSIPGVLEANIFVGTHHTLIVGLSVGTPEPIHIQIPDGAVGSDLSRGDSIDVVFNPKKTHIFHADDAVK